MYAYRYASKPGRKSSSVVRKNHSESFAGMMFSCWMWPKCAVSVHSPVSAFMTIELPSRPEMTDSSPVK